MSFNSYFPRLRVLAGLVGALVVLNILIWSAFFPAPKQFLQAVSPESPSEVRVAALLAPYQGTTTLPVAEKTTGCLVDGPLPDAACSPGAVFPNATPAQICVPGYTKQVRSVSTKLKKQIYTAYGMGYPPPTGSYELDHIVPLALGGSNDAANLYPEAKDPAPGFQQKDIVEVYLYEEMCAGRVALGAAQALIAKNWLSVYQVLDPSDIARLKAKYPSWSN